MNMKGRQYKKCPRCGEKALLASNKCSDCGLIFARLKRASDVQAQKHLKQKEKHKVIYTSQLPLDIIKWKLILYCILGGMFGLHCFYVGRKLRGYYYLICFSIIMLIIIFQIDLIWAGYDAFMSVFAIFGGIMGIMWIYDIFLVSIGKFKVPVAILPEEGRI